MSKEGGWARVRSPDYVLNTERTSVDTEKKKWPGCDRFNADLPGAVPPQTTYAVPPGAYLEEWMEEEGLSSDDVAALLGRDVDDVKDIVNGRVRIDADLAAALEKIVGISAKSWQKYQVAYYTDKRRIAIENRSSKRLPGILPSDDGDRKLLSVSYSIGVSGQTHEVIVRFTVSRSATMEMVFEWASTAALAAVERAFPGMSVLGVTAVFDDGDSRSAVEAS